MREDLTEDFNFIALNTGAGTYVRRTGEESHLDIAMASINVETNSQWMILDDTLGSDHLPVAMVIDDQPALEESTQPQWAYRRAHWDSF